ncbi:unnamed protein product [Urochloa humidicola]
MMQCLGGTTSMLSPAALYQQPCTYRDWILRASVPGGQCKSAARFFPAGSDAAAEEGTYYCWSSSSSTSSPAASDASAVSLSFSSDGDLPFSGFLDGVEELRAIALQMVHDGYMKGLIRSFSATGSSSSAHRGGLGPGQELLLGSWFWELDVEWILLTREGDKVQAHAHLDLDDGCASLLDLMERWIKALKTMVQVLCIMQLELRAKRPAAIAGVRRAIRYFTVLATGKKAEREQEVSQFVRFAEASILRMLDFVDAVADAALNDDRATETLPGMLQVYTCVVDDSPAVLALFKEASTRPIAGESRRKRPGASTRLPV